MREKPIIVAKTSASTPKSLLKQKMLIADAKAVTVWDEGKEDPRGTATKSSAPSITEKGRGRLTNSFITNWLNRKEIANENRRAAPQVRVFLNIKRIMPQAIQITPPSPNDVIKIIILSHSGVPK